MIVLDPGHRYELESLDGELRQVLQFVKRCDPPEKYPGNTSAYPGATVQEVLRALLDRLVYVNQQRPCAETEACVHLLRTALMLLEVRASRHHGTVFEAMGLREVEGMRPCPSCGHLRCAHFAAAPEENHPDGE